MKRQGFAGPFKESELPKQIDPSELEALVIRLRNGDSTVKKTIVGGHMRLAMAIVATYASKYSYITDDLVGAAMMGVVQAVDWAQTRLINNNITPYIAVTIKRYVRDTIEQRHVIHVPRHVFMRDEPIPIVQEITFKEDEDYYRDEFDSLLELSGQDQEHPMIFEDLLNQLNLTPRDRLVVNMLLAGYRQIEIANALEISNAMVTIIKKDIGNKLIQYLQKGGNHELAKTLSSRCS